MWVNYYIIGALLLTWIILMAWGGSNIRAYYKVLFCEKINAIVTSVYYETENWISTEGGGTETYHNYHFKYEYTVDGIKYKGNSGNAFIGYDAAMQKGERKKGDSVEVLYNPDNPSESYYSRVGLTGGIFIFLLAQLFLVIAIDMIKKLQG